MQSGASRPVRGAAWCLTVVLAVAVAACTNRTAEPTVVLHGDRGPVPVRVELALDAATQARGLMFRDHLDEDAGMLFVFDDDARRAFWMKNTPLPLDILYIRSDGTIGHIARDTKPYSEASIPSRGPARYVLEVNAGFTARHGIEAGDRAELPASVDPP